MKTVYIIKTRSNAFSAQLVSHILETELDVLVQRLPNTALASDRLRTVRELCSQADVVIAAGTPDYDMALEVGMAYALNTPVIYVNDSDETLPGHCHLYQAPTDFILASHDVVEKLREALNAGK